MVRFALSIEKRIREMAFVSWLVVVLIFGILLKLIDLLLISSLVKRGVLSTLSGATIRAFMLVVILAPTVLSGLFFEFPDPGERLFSINMKTGARSEHQFGTFEYGRKLAWLPPLGSLPYEKRLQGKVTFIVHDNVLRQVTYSLGWQITDPFQYLAVDDRWHAGLGAVSRVEQDVLAILERRMYEFNNDRISELKEFDNPREERQVRKLKDLVEQWFNERTKRDGITVSFIGARVE